MWKKIIFFNFFCKYLSLLILLRIHKYFNFFFLVSFHFSAGITLTPVVILFLMSINSLLNSSILKSLITFSKYKRPIVLNYTTRHPSNLSKCLTEFPGYTKFLYHLLFILLLTSFLAVLTSFCLTEFYDLLSIFAFRPLVGKPLVSLPAVLTLLIFRSSLNLTYNSFFHAVLTKPTPLYPACSSEVPTFTAALLGYPHRVLSYSWHCIVSFIPSKYGPLLISLCVFTQTLYLKSQTTAAVPTFT